MIQKLLAEGQGIGTFEGVGVFLNGAALANEDATCSLFTRLSSTIFGFLTIVAALAFLLYFVLGAITWITSGGSKEQVEKARNQMTNAAIGLVAVIASYTIAGIVSLVLGINILDPCSTLDQVQNGTTTATP